MTEYRKTWTHRILSVSYWVCIGVVALGVIHDLPTNPILTGLVMVGAVVLMFKLQRSKR